MLVPLAEARRAVEGLAVPRLRVVARPVTDSVGLLVAKTLIARHDLPRGPTSAMDGYAVRARAGGDSGPWTLIGRPDSLAGERPPPLPRRASRYVATGAALPAGANAVVRREAARCVDDRLFVGRPVRPGTDVVEPGEFLRAGERLLERGETVRPVHLAALLAQRVVTLPTFRIRVVVVPIGDELVRPESRSRTGVPDFLAPFVHSMLGFAEVERLDPLPDDRSAIGSTLASRAKRADLLITVGGSSVGPRDLTKAALLERGEVLFEGVRTNVLKRGAVGRIGGVPVLVLPGQVVSAVVTFHEHGLRLLSKMVGRDLARRHEARLARSLAIDHRMDSVYLFRVEDGVATPLPWGVTRMTALLRANAFGVLGRGRRYAAGETIVVQRLWELEGDGSGLSRSPRPRE